jgi:hypothetical protein
LPETFGDDAAQAIWIDRAIEAGAECRAAHRRLGQWATGPPG